MAEPPRGRRLLVVMRLGDAKARDKLRPLLDCPDVAHVTLIRHARVDLDDPKLTQVIHEAGLDQGVAKLRIGRSMRNLWQCLSRGAAIARRDRPDAVIGFNFTPYGVIAWLVGRIAGCATVVALIGADFNTRLRQPLLRLPLRAVLRRCDRITIFSESARQDVITMGVDPERVVVLPNTVDTSRFFPVEGFSPTYDLVFTGYLIRRKGVDHIIRALGLLKRERGVAVTLLIIGDGVERQALQALAVEQGVETQVTFSGWSDDVAGALRSARVFVLLSDAEGLPIAMLEAMASGLPAIVTDVGANAEVVVDGRSGFVLPYPPPAEDVADRIARLLDDAEFYRRAREAALEIHKTHGYDHTARRWSQVLAGLPSSDARP